MARILEFFVRRVSVDGDSMSPTYQSGERVTGVRRWRHVRPGDVVVLRDPRDRARWIIKRCVARVGEQLDLRGDNAEVSTDSRVFGLVTQGTISYIVLEPRIRSDS
ncbi:MAG: S26 family signal peptidase [Acidimicrobiales bacterium]